MEKTINIKNTNENFETELNKIATRVYNQEKTKIAMNLNISLPTSICDVDFRLNLINFIKRTYESRAYYMFYIEQIDYDPILNNDLPLIKQVGDEYIMNIPQDMDIIFYRKNDTVSLTLILKNNVCENKITIFGENEFLCCKINLNSNQIIEAGHKKTEVVIKDNTYNKTYKKGDQILVKITAFFNNRLHQGFGPKINCEGILIHTLTYF